MRRDLKEAVHKITKDRPTVAAARLGGSVRWSSLRWLNRCAECPRVESCKLPQAAQGRKDLLEAKIQLKTEQREQLQKDIAELKTYFLEECDETGRD
jgi:hypothetical protein